jgi:hypothetical protein
MNLFAAMILAGASALLPSAPTVAAVSGVPVSESLDGKEGCSRREACCLEDARAHRIGDESASCFLRDLKQRTSAVLRLVAVAVCTL